MRKELEVLQGFVTDAHAEFTMQSRVYGESSHM